MTHSDFPDGKMVNRNGCFALTETTAAGTYPSRSPSVRKLLQADQQVSGSDGGHMSRSSLRPLVMPANCS